MTVNYTKISYDNGTSEFGAFIDTGYGKNKTAAPVIGDAVIVTTKSGEKHTRIIRRIVREYASGVKVAFVKDAAIEQVASAKYAAKVAESKPAVTAQTFANRKIGSQLCKRCDSYCYVDCTAN